ncbi:hypothetical protein MXB_2038 [Myxobolus squamalis]|nr:hypothetical protein MXB_2038 [Myxobolus squamalis]
MNDIRNEISSTHDPENKQGILKLIFIHIFGYDISWSTFAMVSLIGQARLHYKQVGYLGVSLIIHQNKEFVSLLINSMFKVGSNRPGIRKRAAFLLFCCTRKVLTND